MLFVVIIPPSPQAICLTGWKEKIDKSIAYCEVVDGKNKYYKSKEVYDKYKENESIKYLIKNGTMVREIRPVVIAQPKVALSSSGIVNLPLWLK